MANPATQIVLVPVRHHDSSKSPIFSCLLNPLFRKALLTSLRVAQHCTGSTYALSSKTQTFNEVSIFQNLVHFQQNSTSANIA